MTGWVPAIDPVILEVEIWGKPGPCALRQPYRRLWCQWPLPFEAFPGGFRPRLGQRDRILWHAERHLRRVHDVPLRGRLWRLVPEPPPVGGNLPEPLASNV